MQNQSSTMPPLASPLAEVRAHDQVMRYRRAGQGRPLLVLRAPNAAGVWPELDAHLAARFRVIIPEIPAGCEDVAAWLKHFLEGIGLHRVVVLATDPCCLSALELALLDVSQVERLVLVPGGHAGETGLDGTLGTSLDGVTVPLLVVRRGLAADDALPLVQHFLGTAAATG
jgi:hypothetical protein